MRFKSIKWRFVVIYFLLVLLVMLIVGLFITSGLEREITTSTEADIKRQIESMVSTSGYFVSDEWNNSQNIQGIQATIDDRRFSADETIFVIDNDTYPGIIATNSQEHRLVMGKNAYTVKDIDESLLMEALKGKTSSEVSGSEEKFIHMAYSVLSSSGRVKGVIYVTSSIKQLTRTLFEARKILSYASLIALFITVCLAFLLANNIIEPIRNLTEKAQKMAQGDFNQKVEVKSDDEIGQLASMFNNLTDELKLTLREKDLERRKLNTIFDYMADAVLALDHRSELIHANPVAEKILDIDKKRDGGRFFNTKSIGLGEINFDNPYTLEGEKELEIKDKIYKVRYAPFENDDFSLGGIIVMFLDMTKEHRLEMMRREFVANVSHELKTPITSIISYSETLLDSEVDKLTQRKFLNVIEREAERMNRLVSDLLLLSNLDLKKKSELIETCDLVEVVKDSRDNLIMLAMEKNQSLEYCLCENKVEVKINRDSLLQIIVNLISNAIKYTDENGKIEVRVYEDERAAYMSVKDNGIGIPDEDIQRIFERFYRVEKGRSRKMGGTGLGLSIAKEIARSCNGDIKVVSKLGEGSTFTLELKKNI